MSQSRCPATATRPGMNASTSMPRRSGTDRQIDARSTRTSARRSERGLGRARLPARLQAELLAQRAVQRPSRRHRAEEHGRPRASAASTTDVRRPGPHTPPAPVGRREVDAHGRAVVQHGDQPVGEHQRHHGAQRQRRRGTEPQDPVRSAPDALEDPADHLAQRRRERDPQQQRHRRGPQLAGPEDVAGGTEHRPRLDQPRDVERRQQQRAEVLGDRWRPGTATACSRGTTSRPPPDAIAARTASTRKPR